MSNLKFDSFKDRMARFGYEIDSRIEQRDVGGLLGMYAKETIPEGTLFAKFPLASRIPFSEDIDFPDSPDKSNFQTIHSMARELGDPSSKYQLFFEYCGVLDDRKQSSVCFFEPEDFNVLHRLNPVLALMAGRSKLTFDETVEEVCQKDASLDVEHVMLATSIFRERCWGGSLGFFPGMDLFNHNTKSLIELKSGSIDGEKFVTYTAPHDIESGQEIKITYGKKDIFHFATNYGFFDPSDFHLIGYCNRLTQPIGDAFSRKVVENLKKHYAVREFTLNGQSRFQVQDVDAYFLDRGPNNKMVDLASRLAISDKKELSKGCVDERTTARYLLYILETFKSINKVDQIDLEQLPTKLHIYHKMLKKELRILEDNIATVRLLCV